MTIEALPGVRAERLLGLLTEAHTALTNVRGAGAYPDDLYNNYLRWANEQVRMLRYALPSDALNEIVTTRRHWALVNLDPSTMGTALAGFVGSEIEDQLHVLEARASELRAEIERHAAVSVFLAPDTNVYVHNPSTFDQLHWAGLVGPDAHDVRLLVPLVVIDELDRLKNRGSSSPIHEDTKVTARARARTTIKILEGMVGDPREPVVLRAATASEPEVTVAVVLDDPGHVRLADADSEIVDRVRAVADAAGKSAKVVTSDLGMALRARVAGLESAKPPLPDGG